MRRLRVSLLCAPLFLLACGGDDTNPPPPTDASVSDAGGGSDSGPHADGAVDSGPALDASDSGNAGDASDSGSAEDASDGGNAADASDGGGATDASDGGNAGDAGDGGTLVTGSRVPTGDFITPTAAPGSAFVSLKPGAALIPQYPDYAADHASSTAVSPDGKTLLILTSGYNMIVNRSGANEGYEDPTQSGEYIFVYDLTTSPPTQKQVLKIPNSFSGLAFNPKSNEFYVSGGKDDCVHVFDLSGSSWAEVTKTVDGGTAPAIALGHASALGLQNGPVAAGIAVNGSGTKLVVANYENDSISLVDVATKAVTAELDLRPGKAATNPQSGVAGGEFPYWVAIQGDTTAYVSSQRDREVDVVDLTVSPPVVKGRIAVGGQPNKLILNKDGSRLFVANGNSDTVSIIDTSARTVLESVQVLAPSATFANPIGLKGANPNGLRLSPDEKTLYVTDGATNAVAVVQRDPAQTTGATTVGLIPTGWYPTDVVTSADGSQLYVINAKSVPGPSCHDVVQEEGDAGTLDGGFAGYNACWNGNQYVWQLETSGLLSLPVPSAPELANLTLQVAQNDHFATVAPDATMTFLNTKIKHIIFVIKENRTFDQVLGDLGKGNGDSSLTIFPNEVTPNFHAMASQFVTLDAFLDTGETSGVGWNWTTSAHATDEVEHNQPINYGKGGTTYDWEGTNRNINVGLAAVADRMAWDPLNPSDPDLLPGAVDVSAADGPGSSNQGTGYLWDGALRKGLTVRNYGAFCDLSRYYFPSSSPYYVPYDKAPFTAGHQQSFPAKAALKDLTDVYFRAFDQAYPDWWRYLEWKREFDGFVTGNNLPALELVRLPHDHTGSFTAAQTVAKLGTPLLEVADNDASVGALVAAVAASAYATNTLIFVVEDDAQDGADHVDAHRSTAFIVGPYVKQSAVVSTPYTTVSLVHTIEAILGTDPVGLYDALAAPMSDVFDTTLDPTTFKYTALQSDLLAGTGLLSMRVTPQALRKYKDALARGHDSAYWQRVSAEQNFEREDAVDSAEYNRILWEGLMGNRPYPEVRSQIDYSKALASHAPPSPNVCE
jgi:YVTN family beta-propeller protein